MYSAACRVNSVAQEGVAPIRSIGTASRFIAVFGVTDSTCKHSHFYAAASARPGGMRAGFEYFRAFGQDAVDFARFSNTPLPMPRLVLTGEKASGEFLSHQTRLVATNVECDGVRHAGHWLMEEAPDQVIPSIVGFLKR